LTGVELALLAVFGGLGMAACLWLMRRAGWL
jgi:hypothetical protein